MRSFRQGYLFTLLCLLLALEAQAAGTRLLATGGAATIEGAAGGGLVPWATITGYGSREEVGGSAFATRVDTGDYRLDVQGATVGLFNRIELSAARQELDLVALGPALGLRGAHLRQHVIGAKVRLVGDVPYTRLPQISLGVQYKKQQDFELARALGARDDADVDVYLAATKVFLGGAGGYNAFLSGVARLTRANETGLIGFGGDRRNARRVVFEASGGVLLSRHVAIGAEYRGKSGGLARTDEDAWRDVFLAWFPNRHLSVVVAYTDLGTVATLRNQTGWYLSLQGVF